MGISELARTAVANETSMSSLNLFLYLAVKRLFDMVFSAVALVLLAPLFGIIAIAIRLDSSGPVIYKQRRVLGGQAPDEPYPERKVFDFFKFRSMYINNDSSAHQEFVRRYMNGESAAVNNGSSHKPLFKMKRDPRITRIGTIIRRTSLDELPQLVNVLKGDMTLVGPRPALLYEVAQYSVQDRQRLIPQAGLTGLWQVSGRACLTFDQMIKLDVEYAQKRSLRLDLKILLKTLPVILIADGAW